MREPVAEVAIPSPHSGLQTMIQRAGAIGLFCILAACTLTTLDDSSFQRFLISAFLMGFAALYWAASVRRRFVWSVPQICVLLMACYGAGQTLWSPQKIVYNGWITTLFWFTAAIVTTLATQLFAGPPANTGQSVAKQFRYAFAIFGSAVCLLDVLQQASHTGEYYWSIPSLRYSVFGPFAYYNNFSQFVELVFPVTMWIGLGSRKQNILFIALGALQISAVVSSSSRAGTVLILVELFAILILAYLRNRKVAILPVLGLALLTTAIFVYATGMSDVLQKLQRRDQVANRREINLASLAMIRQRPLTGWGLGTYVQVYPKFARYDDGTWVNRAHNDWFEWTAEGGVFFSGLMLIVFVWSIVPAVRSVWGIGLIAVCLHAVVDYPFARLGVCGWYFALLGMLAVLPAVEEADQRGRRRVQTVDRSSLSQPIAPSV